IRTIERIRDRAAGGCATHHRTDRAARRSSAETPTLALSGGLGAASANPSLKRPAVHGLILAREVTTGRRNGGLLPIRLSSRRAQQPQGSRNDKASTHCTSIV